VVTGKLVPEAAKTGTGTIDITKNGNESTTIEIPKNGKFSIELEFSNEFTLTFKYPGNFNKIITVSTEIPLEVLEHNNDFPPFAINVQLTKEIEGIDKSFAIKPSVRIYYEKKIDNFKQESYASDLQFAEQVANAKKQDNQVAKETAVIAKENAQDLVAKQRDFDQIIKEADTFYQRGEYQMALVKYVEGHGLFPDKAYPNDRIAELQDLVKALAINGKQKTELEQKYKSAIAKANGFFDQKSYNEARPLYEEALQYKPGDVFANGRINEINQLLASLEVQNKFKELVSNADSNYKSKKYDQAISLYNQAKQLIPDDQYPQSQIDLINQEKQQLSKLDQLEKDFNQAMQLANDLTRQKDYPQALSMYKKAIGLKPESKLVRDKITETEQAMIALENDKKYLQAIQLADKSLSNNDLQNAKIQYQEALTIKQEEYPKAKLAEIAATEAKEIEFKNLVSKAEKAFLANNFDEALAAFTDALKLKPGDLSVKKRIEDIQNLKNKELSEKEYAGLIAQADQNFNTNQFGEAIAAYNKALLIKKSDVYPKDQLRKIESYQSYIKKADNYFLAKDYSGSIEQLNIALETKPNDSYATTKIAEISKIISDQKQLEEQKKAELQAYNEAISAADQLFISKKYTESLSKYKNALALKSDETYPQKRIKEIETILDGIQKETVRIENEYNASIARADLMLEQKDYPNAQAEYRKALTIKTEEVYPKDQIQKIDNILAENKRKEEDLQKQQQEKQDLAFNQAMAAADKLFADNDFNSAKTGYETALGIRPNDPDAKKKYAQTEAMLAQIAQNTEAYNKAITEANNRLTKKQYPEAKEKYLEALQYLPNSEYPKQQIAQIDELLAQQEAGAKLRRDFDRAMTEAESLFKAKDLLKAKEAFTKANSLIPAEPVPPQRLNEINNLLADQERKDVAQKTLLEAYQKVIQRADNQFSNKNYNEAILTYNEALGVKQGEQYPKDQLVLIQKLLKEQNEQNYKSAIAKADDLLKSDQLDDAATNYNEALKYKKDDVYTRQKLAVIAKKKADIETEKNRLKTLEDQYNVLITDANNNFGNKAYPLAREKYQKALALKPNETYPKDQLAKIDGLIKEQQLTEEKDKQYAQFIQKAEDAYKANKLKEARALFQNGNELKPLEPLPPMRIAEIDKKLAQQEETARLAAQEVAQQLAKEKADKEQFVNAVAAGDKTFASKQYVVARGHYTEALTVFSGEKYPKDQIAKIDVLLAKEEQAKVLSLQKAQQDSMQKTKDKLFDAAIAEAKDHESGKRYEQAILKYNGAISIKPDQRPVVQKYIAEIEKKIQLVAKQEAEYKRMIKLADSYFTASKLNEALTEYQQASTIKPDEEYPKNRIKEADQKIADANRETLSKAALDKAYNEAMETAEKFFKDDQLASAKAQFKAALSIKPDEKLPVQRMNDIDALIDQRNKEQLAKQQLEIDEKYRQLLSVADNLFSDKSYTNAKIQYQQASAIKPDEEYPKNRIKEADQKIADANREALSKAALDKAYNEAMENAEKLFKDDQLASAKAQFRAALLVKPDEKLPVQRMNDIDALIDQRNKEQLAKQSETDQSIEERAEKYTTTTDYNEAIKKADDKFGVKDYSVARFYYYKALEIKPAEEYPKKQIDTIRKLIDSQLSAVDLSEYNKAIVQADNAFSDKNYAVAKFFYYKALDIKSWEEYPKGRINEILALTNSLLSEREEKEYRDAIAKADEAFVNKDMVTSRFYYNMALNIKRDEDYPRIKLKDIQKLLAQGSVTLTDEQYKKFVDLGDEALQLKNYTAARFNYNKALTLKPDEKYPKDQLKKIKAELENPAK
jgi:tetratricopeptide (TPR) repeat protein